MGSPVLGCSLALGSPLNTDPLPDYFVKAELRIGWTTVDSLEAAEKLSCQLVESGLAACVQIESLVGSVYRWEGKVRQVPEWRLVVKFVAAKGAEIEALVEAQHPYECPQWIVLRPESVSDRYLAWVTGSHP